MLSKPEEGHNTDSTITCLWLMLGITCSFTYLPDCSADWYTVASGSSR
ncbi:MAG: hypothetical protein F6K63_04895 [Moorea sp. SIO1G6]|nr:hypothetical protein [Moorena sp. SIO1G6]NET63769.1 hypothetical protein [Moorena sp. SIO1G6]